MDPFDSQKDFICFHFDYFAKVSTIAIAIAPALAHVPPFFALLAIEETMVRTIASKYLAFFRLAFCPLSGCSFQQSFFIHLMSHRSGYLHFQVPKLLTRTPLIFYFL